MTEARYLRFNGERKVALSAPMPLEFSADDQLIVQSLYSGISYGTESKIYEGTWPHGLSLDASIPGMTEPVDYPLGYGYATVGRVLRSASPANKALEGELVFCFRPHGSHHIVTGSELIPLPPLADPRLGVFIPNLETAVGLVMDTAPIMAENVAVIGLGVVGQLVTKLLSRHPLGRLIAIDKDAFRLELCDRCLDAGGSAATEQALAIELLGSKGYDAQLAPLIGQVDAVIEVSGSGSGLMTASKLVTRTGRITLGSLYSDNEADGWPFAPTFHRSQVRMICSQVSQIDPVLAGRFSKERRMAYVLRLLTELADQIAPLITHRVPFEQADSAYRMLATKGSGSCQVVLEYNESSATPRISR